MDVRQRKGKKRMANNDGCKEEEKTGEKGVVCEKRRKERIEE